MRLLHCNLGSHAIFVPILTALALFLMSTTACGRLEREVEKDQNKEKDQEQDKKKDKEKDGRTEL